MDFMDGRCWITLRARNISFCFGELIRDSYSPVARFLSMQGDDLITSCYRPIEQSGRI